MLPVLGSGAGAGEIRPGLLVFSVSRMEKIDDSGEDAFGVARLGS